MKTVSIIGGGISGLACAVNLTSLGYKVNLYEAKPFCGGRAYSFFSKDLQTTIDNGQHIFMGCYLNTIRFLKQINGLNFLNFQENLKVLFNSINYKFLLDCPNLIAPLNLVTGIIKTKHFSNTELLKASKLLFNIYLNNVFKIETNKTAYEILKENNQSDSLIKNIWEPIIVGTLNGNIFEISGDLFIKTIFRIFLIKEKFSSIGFTITGLSDLYVNKAEKYITNNGGFIYRHCRAIDFLINNKKIEAIKLSNNKIIKSDFYILAIPYFELLKFKKLIIELDIDYINTFKSSPIITIYFTSDTELTSEPITIILNSKSKVLINRTNNLNFNKKYIYSITISNANDLINKDNNFIFHSVIEDIKKIYGSKICINNHKIIKERNATLKIIPSVEKKRPKSHTKIKNLFLIGDWVKTELPATIESAVKSGSEIIKLI